MNIFQALAWAAIVMLMMAFLISFTMWLDHRQEKHAAKRRKQMGVVDSIDTDTDNPEKEEPRW